jgi:hypothetical protein
MNSQTLARIFSSISCSLVLLILSVSAFSQTKPVKLVPLKQGIVNGLKNDEGIKPASWINFNHPQGAFSVKLPSQPEEMNKEVANTSHPGYPPFMINMYISLDSAEMVSYLVRYNDYPTGMYLADKKASLDALTAEFQGKGDIVKAARPIYKDGYEGRAIDILINGLYMEVQVFLRGNRTYLLLRQGSTDSPPTINDGFFDSFKFNKYLPVSNTPFSIGQISLGMPNKPVAFPAEVDVDRSFLKDNISNFSANPNTGGVYGIEHAKLSKYLRIKKLDSIYKYVLNELKIADDSIYKVEEINIGTVKATEYFSVNKKSNNYRRGRIWVNNYQFYSQTVLVNKEELESPEVNNFFNSVKHPAQNNVQDLKSSKATLIVQDLLSKDTAVYNAAHGALYYYDFDKEELPAVYSALKHKYADDTTTSGTRLILIRKLGKLQDEKTIPLLKELYADAKNSDLLRENALIQVPAIDSASFDWYFKELTENPPLNKTDYSWSLFRPLSDSLSYVAAHIDKVLNVLDVQAYSPNVLYILSDMLSEKNKAKYQPILETKKDRIAAVANRDLNIFSVNVKAKENNLVTSIYRYLDILPALNMQKLTDEFTNKLFAIDSIPYVRTSALAARIKAGLPLDKKILEAQLDSLESRYEIINTYQELGKLDQVPFKYRKHDEFAKLKMYSYLVDEYDAPERIQLLGSVKDGTDTYYTFSFIYTEDDVKKEYVGIVGPFNTAPDQLKFDDYLCHSKFEVKAADWTAQAKALIAELKEE